MEKHPRESPQRLQSRCATRLHQEVNKRQDARGRGNWEHWLYEAMTAGQERRRLPLLFARQREQNLPTTFQYCSHSPVEAVPENTLTCCLGQQVASCPILQDTVGHLVGEFPPELLDQAQADICVGHIVFLCAQAGHMVHDNTGYIHDATDRLYWDRFHANLAAMADDIPEEEA